MRACFSQSVMIGDKVNDMTMLASWCGIDTHGISSAYIVADSRFSWGNGFYFDYGKKVFACSKYPEIFGYAGDVLFPSVVLAQLVDLIDAGVLFNNEMTKEEKNSVISERIGYTFSKYPDVLENRPIQIIHISRDTNFSNYPSFKCFLMRWNESGVKHTETIEFPEKSGVIHVLGSGKNAFIKNYERYEKAGNTGTSRNVFHCFISTLANINDTQCGGPPQLVGLYRKPLTNGNKYGIIYNNQRYFEGIQLPSSADFDIIEWRNEQFELCNGLKKRRFIDAMPQPDPLR